MPQQPIQWKHKVQYYETDQMGIVHHSNYIRWFEESRVAFLEAIGFGYKELEERGIISPVLSVSCTYKQMTRFGESVYIIPHVSGFNGVRLSVSYMVVGAEDGVLRAEGETCHCFLDEQGRPLRLKKMHPDYYEALMKCLDEDKTVLK